MDEMAVEVEIRPESDYPDVVAEAGKRLSRLVKDTIGISARVQVVPPGMIERSLGKAKRVYDQRPKG
jgi:phenylacetate-CoA ligase